MNAPTTIRQYVRDLEDALKVRLARQERIVCETREHLQDAVDAEVAHGTARDEAERRATAAFGPSRELAASFGSEGTTAIGRGFVAFADVLHRKLDGDRYLLVRAAAGFAATCAAGAVIFAVGGMPLQYGLLVVAFLICVEGYADLRRIAALPRRGYTRRFLKLDAGVRERLLRALREGEPVSDPSAADYAAEVAVRARRLGPSLAVHGAWAAYVAVFVAVGDLEPGTQIVWGVVVLVIAAHFAMTRHRGPRIALAELELLQLVDDVVDMREDGIEAGLEERHKLNRRSGFDNVFALALKPSKGERRTTELAANDREIKMWIDGQQLRFRGPDRLGELKLCLSAFVTGRYETDRREVARRGLPRRRRRTLEQITTVFETAHGPHRYPTQPERNE